MNAADERGPADVRRLPRAGDVASPRARVARLVRLPSTPLRTGKPDPPYGFRLRSASLGLILVCLLSERPIAGQAPDADGIGSLLTRLQHAVEQQDAWLFDSLFAPTVARGQVERYRQEMMSPGATRRMLRELGRAEVEDAPAGTAHRLFVELFEETGGRARVVSASLTVRRPPDGGADSWRIAAADGLSTVQGLYRLRLDPAAQFAAEGLEISAPDLALSLKSGTVFQILSDEGVAGLVLLGRGEMQFAPSPETERGQLRLFSGRETLVTRVHAALVRFNPQDYPARVTRAALRPVPVDPGAMRRAADIVDRELPRALSVDVRDVSPHDWYVLPREGDFIAEIRTAGHGPLTFSRFSALPEDVSLVRRDRGLTIALYRSASRVETLGRSYSDEDEREYDILHYDIAATVSPARRLLTARAQLTIRARVALSTLTLRLADALAVTAVTSAGTGALGFVRLKNQNALFVRLPTHLLPDTDLTLTVAYTGNVDSQPLESEEFQGRLPPSSVGTSSHLLLSSASLWYPQNPFTDYATARLQIATPEGYATVASGEPDEAGDAAAPRQAEARGDRTFVFNARRPLRYLALLTGRFARVEARTLPLGDSAADQPYVTLTVDAPARHRAHARDLIGSMEHVLRFYSSLMGEIPYPSTALALVDGPVPGGHSPAYFAMLNVPDRASGVSWDNDPASFQGFPEFFLAHELAHQWWGQAVGWKNYHEQWISEGFAQYFAALYGHTLRGDRVFHDMLRQFRRWSLSESGQGPVHLGQRLGQIRGGPRVYRALVYNKGAAVLHMLRRIVGDEVFFQSLRRFYETHRFRTAGTDDLRRVVELESGRSLERFFDRWIHGTDIPRIGYRVTRSSREVALRLEQTGTHVFDVPITVTLAGDDGRTRDELVVMTERQLDVAWPASSGVRQVRLNRDFAALAEFVER